MSACSRNYKFGRGMLALHVLSATARILTMAQHMRAQNHRVRALTIRVHASTIRPNGLCNQSTNHDHARPYLCSHKSKNANSNAPSTRLIRRQSKSCCIPYMLSITLYIQYTPMPVYSNHLRTYHTRSMAVYKSQDFATINHLS